LLPGQFMNTIRLGLNPHLGTFAWLIRCSNFSRALPIATLVIIFLSAHVARALAAQAKPLVKVVVGYGSTDDGVAILGFAKETKLFEKRGLDVELVGMGTGSVSLRALIAKDLEISSLSGSGLVQAALQGADTVLIAALINGFVFKVFSAPEISSPAQLKGKKLGVSRYGATSDFAVRLALKKWGLNPDRDVIFCKSAHHRTLSAPCRPKCSTQG
jgi:NitT/TauT family transport system substrate-binding protein